MNLFSYRHSHRHNQQGLTFTYLLGSHKQICWRGLCVLYSWCVFSDLSHWMHALILFVNACLFLHLKYPLAFFLLPAYFVLLSSSIRIPLPVKSEVYNVSACSNQWDLRVDSVPFLDLAQGCRNSHGKQPVALPSKWDYCAEFISVRHFTQNKHMIPCVITEAQYLCSLFCSSFHLLCLCPCELL